MMKKLALALLAVLLAGGIVWATYEGTERLQYDTTVVEGFFKVLGGYELAGTGGAGWADSLRDSTGTTYSADDYTRRNKIEGIEQKWNFYNGIHLGQIGISPEISQYIYFGGGETKYIGYYYNYPNDLWFSSPLDVHFLSDTTHVNYLKATGSNLPGMTIYSGDSVYEGTCWILQGNNIALTQTDSGIQIAASGTTAAIKSDSVYDSRTGNYHGGADYGRLNQDQEWTGTQSYSGIPVFPTGTKVDSADVADSASFAWDANDADSLRGQKASSYFRSDKQDTVTTPVYFENDVYIGDGESDICVFDGLLTHFKDFVYIGHDADKGDSIKGAKGGDPPFYGLYVEDYIQCDKNIDVDGSLFVDKYFQLADSTKHNLVSTSATYAESSAKAGWAGTMSNGSILWNWFASAAQESARGVTSLKSGDSTYKGDVYIEASTGMSISQTGSSIVFATSGTLGTVPIAESLDVNGTPYDGAVFARKNANETITGNYTHSAGANFTVNGPAYFNGNVDFVGDAKHFYVESDDIRFGDDFTDDTVGIHANLNVFSNVIIDPTAKGGSKELHGNLTVANDANIGGDIIVTGNVDGYNVGTMGAKLATIETSAKDDQTITAGDGLEGGGTGNVILNIGEGDGIHVETDAIEVDVSDLNGTGLGVTGNDLYVKYGSSSGTACQGNNSRLPTQDENNALAGEGIPSSSNKFVTKNYAQTTYANVAEVETVTAYWRFESDFSDYWEFYDPVKCENGAKIYEGIDIWDQNDNHFSIASGLLDANMASQFDSTAVFNGTVTMNGAVNIYTATYPIDITDKDISLTPGGVSGNYIQDGTITNNDIGPTADIAKSKISNDGTWPNAEVDSGLTIGKNATVRNCALNPGFTFPIYSDFTQAGTSDDDTAAELPEYQEAGTTYRTKLKIAFFKTTGMHSVTVRLEARAVYAGSPHTGTLQLTIDGATAGTATFNSDDWTEKTTSVDVSGLTNNTYHEIAVKLKDSSSETAKIRKIFIYGTSEAGL